MQKKFFTQGEAGKNEEVPALPSAAHAAEDAGRQRELPVPSCPGAFPLPAHGGIDSLGWPCLFDGTVPRQLAGTVPQTSLPSGMERGGGGPQAGTYVEHVFLFTLDTLVLWGIQA